LRYSFKPRNPSNIFTTFFASTTPVTRKIYHIEVGGYIGPWCNPTFNSLKEAMEKKYGKAKKGTVGKYHVKWKGTRGRGDSERQIELVCSADWLLVSYADEGISQQAINEMGSSEIDNL